MSTFCLLKTLLKKTWLKSILLIFPLPPLFVPPRKRESPVQWPKTSQQLPGISRESTAGGWPSNPGASQWNLRPVWSAAVSYRADREEVGHSTADESVVSFNQQKYSSCAKNTKKTITFPCLLEHVLFVPIQESEE